MNGLQAVKKTSFSISLNFEFLKPNRISRTMVKDHWSYTLVSRSYSVQVAFENSQIFELQRSHSAKETDNGAL